MRATQALFTAMFGVSWYFARTSLKSRFRVLVLVLHTARCLTTKAVWRLVSLTVTPLTTAIPNRARVAPRTCRTVHSPLSCALRVRHMIDVIMRPSLAGITMLANCADASCLSSRRVTDPELRRFCSRCDVHSWGRDAVLAMIPVIYRICCRYAVCRQHL